MAIIQSQMSFRSLYLYIKEMQGRKGDGKSNQIASVSYGACERLAKSLVAIIYLTL